MRRSSVMLAASAIVAVLAGGGAAGLLPADGRVRLAAPAAASDGDGCSVAAGNTSELIAALAAVEPGCATWHVDLDGTFPLTEALVWSNAASLHLSGPPGGLARIEAAGPSTAHRLLTSISGSGFGGPITLERLVLTGGDVYGSGGMLEANAGGAVLALDLTLIDVELVGNAALRGGAVAAGTLTAVRTSFIDNVADPLADDDGFGGAVFVQGGTLTLVNVTFAGNAAVDGGAVYAELPATGPGLDATYVTFVGNETDPAGGGADLYLDVAPASGVRLRGVLFAGPAAAEPSCLFTTPVGDLTAFEAEGSFALDTSCGVSVLAGPPELGRVAFLAPPSGTGIVTTDLFVPLGSWDGLDALTCIPGITTDQRGLSRPQGAAGRCDTGAVERLVVGSMGGGGTDDGSGDDAGASAGSGGPVPTSVPAGTRSAPVTGPFMLLGPLVIAVLAGIAEQDASAVRPPLRPPGDGPVRRR